MVVREDLLGHALPACPSAFDYRLVAQSDSMYNTPPTYGIYIAGLVFQWIKRQGGIAEMERRALERSGMLYEFLDSSRFFRNPVRQSDRSRMNVPFTLADSKLDDAFLAGAKQQGMIELKGHRSVGGMRASIYNAMPLQGVQLLVDYMKEFEAKRG